MVDSTPTPTFPNNSSNTVTTESSCFKRTVVLTDWWLIKAENDFEGKRLAVAGIPPSKTVSPFMKGAKRVFVSAPIVKRFDVFSLETVDGINIIIRGLINEQRTLENGFPAEVLNGFAFGFPPNWKSCVVGCFSKELATGIDSGVEQSIPTSSVSQETSGDHEKPFSEDKCGVSKQIGGVNVVYGSGGIRRSARLRNIEVHQKKSKPASGGPPKHPGKEQSASPGSLDLENPDGEGQKSPVVPVQSQLVGQIDIASEQLVKKSASRTRRPFSPNTEGCSKKACREIGGVDVVYGSGENRHSARLHNIEVCQQKSETASGGPPKQPDKELSIRPGALDLENHVAERLKSPVTPVQSQLLGQVNISSEQLVKKSESRISRDLSPDTEGCYKETTEHISGVDVVYGSGKNKRSARLHNIEVCQKKSMPASGGPAKRQDIVVGVEQSIPTTSLASPKEASGDHEKPFPEDNCNVSKEMGGVNVGSGVNRRSARFQNIKVFQLKSKLASEGSPKQPDIVARVEQSTPTTSLVSPEDTSRDHEKPFPEDKCSALKEMGGVNVYGSGGNRRSARLHNIKACPQKSKPASGGPPKHPDIVAGVEQSTPTTSFVSPEEISGDHDKPFLEDKCNASKEMGGVNVYDSGGNRRSARLHNIKVSLQKSKPASGGPPKHPDKEQSPSPEGLDLENCDGEGLKSPVTSVQSQSLGQLSASPEQLVKNSASRNSRALSVNTEDCYKKKRVTAKTKAITHKRKMTKSASAVKYLQERDGSPLIKGSKGKISSASPKSFKKSRFGRLLLPRLEFWCNQIPVYNADREITEIQNGASLL